MSKKTTAKKSDDGPVTALVQPPEAIVHPAKPEGPTQKQMLAALKAAGHDAEGREPGAVLALYRSLPAFAREAAS